MSAEPNWEEITADKEAKKQQVIDYIKSKCTSVSEHEDLRAISACLANGGRMSISILTGGLANYTYKISATHCDDCDDRHLFAKLSFPFAMRFPDKPCPLSRTENEYIMMKKFYDLSPGCVATPYFCDDIGIDMKLLVTQWSPVDEQFANQFIDGAVDLRVAQKISRAIAALHCSEVDLDFNSTMKPWFNSLSPILKDILDETHNPEGKQDRVSALGMELGREATDEMFRCYEDTVNTASGLCHGDLHVFNVLVGAKPSIETLDNFFDTTGDMMICDWEMSHAGVAGHDLGTLRAFPIACAFAHSINGHHAAALNIINWLDVTWNAYEAAMRKAGTPDEEISKTCRHSLQFSALYLLASYALNIHMDFLPIDEGNAVDLTAVKEAVGYVGLKCFHWGVDDKISLDDLKTNLKQLIDAEMGRILQIKKVRRNRRSSVLRMSGRRVSDANIHYANWDRQSFISADCSLDVSERRSLLGKRLEEFTSGGELSTHVQAAAQ